MKKGARVSAKKGINNSRVVVIVLVVLLIMVGLAYLMRANQKNNLENFEGHGLNNITEEPKSKDDEVLMVLFYTDWCGFCNKFKPVYSEVSKELHNKKVGGKTIKVEAVNCDAGSELEQKVAKDNGIQGYPTLKVWDNLNNGKDYEGSRDKGELVDYLNNLAKN